MLPAWDGSKAGFGRSNLAIWALFCLMSLPETGTGRARAVPQKASHLCPLVSAERDW
jgi:hypothetical protein